MPWLGSCCWRLLAPLWGFMVDALSLLCLGEKTTKKNHLFFFFFFSCSGHGAHPDPLSSIPALSSFLGARCFWESLLMQICCFIALFGAFSLLLSDDFSSSKAAFLLTFHTLHPMPGSTWNSSAPQPLVWLLPELEECAGHESWRGWGRGAVPNRSRLLFLCN